MSKWPELNERAFKLGLTICGSHYRKNYYFLLDLKALADAGRIRRTNDTSFRSLEKLLAEIEDNKEIASVNFFTVEKMIDDTTDRNTTA